MNLKFNLTTVILIVLATIAGSVLIFHFDVFGMYDEEMEDEMEEEMMEDNLYHRGY